jgi:hypothetical protein
MKVGDFPKVACIALLIILCSLKLCGSEPARDSGGSVDGDAGCAAVIASRLAPTVFSELFMDIAFTSNSLWERACSR